MNIKKKYLDIVGKNEWEEILSFLQPKELAVASEVCKSWNHMANQKQLWGGKNGLYNRNNVTWNNFFKPKGRGSRGKSLVIEYHLKIECDKKKRQQAIEMAKKRRKFESWRKHKYEGILQCNFFSGRCKKFCVNPAVCLFFSFILLMISVLAILIILPLKYEGIITGAWEEISVPFFIISVLFFVFFNLLLIYWKVVNYEGLKYESFVNLLAVWMVKFALLLGAISMLFTTITGLLKLTNGLSLTWIEVFSPVLMLLGQQIMLSACCCFSEQFVKAAVKMYYLESGEYTCRHICGGFMGVNALFLFIFLMMLGMKFDGVANLNWVVCFFPVWLWLICSTCVVCLNSLYAYDMFEDIDPFVFFFLCWPWTMVLVFTILFSLNVVGIITIEMYYITIPLYLAFPAFCVIGFGLCISVLMEIKDERKDRY